MVRQYLRFFEHRNIFHMIVLYVDILQAFRMQSFGNAIRPNSTFCHPRFSKSLSCFASLYCHTLVICLLPWHCPSNSLTRLVSDFIVFYACNAFVDALGTRQLKLKLPWQQHGGSGTPESHAKCHVHVAMHLVVFHPFRSTSGMMHSLSAVRKATCHCKASERLRLHAAACDYVEIAKMTTLIQ